MVHFGVVGTSWITEEFIRCASLIEDFQLSAIYSRTEERAREFAKKYRVKYIFTNIEEMAQSDIIDAVYIASPNSLHSKQATLFLKNKKNVFCEKPIASNVKELREMIKWASQSQVLLMEAMKSTCLPNFHVIKEKLEKIGTVRRYFATYCQYSSRLDSYRRGENPNIFNKKFSGGSLMDIGIYCIYPLVALFGKPKEIKVSATLLDSGVDGQGNILLHYDNMDAVIMHSKITASSIPSEIQGEKANIIIDKIHTPEKIIIQYRNGWDEDITLQQRKDIMYYEIDEFIKSVKEGKIESSINTHQLSLEVMEILDTVRKQVGIVYPADI